MVLGGGVYGFWGGALMFLGGRGLWGCPSEGSRV